MVKFSKVEDSKRDELLNSVIRKRGAVTKPIIDEFLKSGEEILKIDYDETVSSSINSLYIGLKSYVKNNKVPVHVFMHEGEIYLKRTDLNGETS